MKTVNVVDMRRLGRLPPARGAAAGPTMDGQAHEQAHGQAHGEPPNRPTVRFLGEAERRSTTSTGRKAKTRGGRLRRGVVVSAAGMVALVVSIGSVSAASAVTRKAKTSGPEKVFVIPHTTTSTTHPGTIVLTGTIGDYGTNVTTNAKGKPTTNGGYSELHLKKGTILVDVAALDKALDAAFGHATIDKSSCSVSARASGAVTIVSGTKAYAGIKGSFTLSGNIAEIAPRTKSGACTFKTTTPPLTSLLEFVGSGTVSLP